MSAKTVPTKVSKINMTKKDTIRPAIANPLGDLKMPTKEKISPSSQNIVPNKATALRVVA